MPEIADDEHDALVDTDLEPAEAPKEQIDKNAARVRYLASCVTLSHDLPDLNTGIKQPAPVTAEADRLLAAWDALFEYEPVPGEPNAVAHALVTDGHRDTGTPSPEELGAHFREHAFAAIGLLEQKLHADDPALLAVRQKYEKLCLRQESAVRITRHQERVRAYSYGGRWSPVETEVRMGIAPEKLQ